MNRFMTLKDHVYEYIAEQIHYGKLLPEEKIDEKVICDELNISRTPVREALIQLASEGILTNNSRKGFIVTTLSAEDLKELYNVIGLLDGAAASKACENLTEGDIKDMAFYVDSMALAIDSGNFEMYQRQQKLFHQVYIDKCGNSVMISTIASLKNKLISTNYDRDTIARVQEVLRRTNEEHRRILELFREKNENGLFEYIYLTHWQPDYVEYELLESVRSR